MRGLLFLDSEQFRYDDETLLCKVKEKCLLCLFYDGSLKTQPYYDVFKRLEIAGCAISLINLFRYPELVHRSKNKKNSISNNTVCLFINGIARYKYNGPPDANECISFVRAILDANPESETFVKEEKVQEGSIPYCEDGLCYMPFNKAYNISVNS